MKYTLSQAKRLRYLGCPEVDEATFDTAEQRDAAFRSQEKEATSASRAMLASMRDRCDPVLVNALAAEVADFLRRNGFMEVSTPIVIPRVYLERMTISADHPLANQVYYVDSKQCLRPMLAPGLYSISRRLMNVLGSPLGVFEIGPCFRKESQGSRHLTCFTMVNFVEWGIPEEDKYERMSRLVSDLMRMLGLEYEQVEEESTVYGRTFDIEVAGQELASGAYGPHPLDRAWDITGTWMGLGMGIERAVCLREGIDNIQRVGRSFAYHNGASINIR